MNDLLDLSKLEAGQMAFDWRPAELGELVDAVIDEFRWPGSEQTAQIRYERPDGRVTATIDSGRVQQVLRNLLSNAVKFSPPAGTILVRLRRVGKAALLTVCDEGPGIPPGEIEAVFDKFVQSSKTKSNTGGTGLGLAICREIVAGHKGRIWAENNAEAGCIFYVELPLDDTLAGRGLTISHATTAPCGIDKHPRTLHPNRGSKERTWASI